jgi:hypothetical protein
MLPPRAVISYERSALHRIVKILVAGYNGNIAAYSDIRKCNIRSVLYLAIHYEIKRGREHLGG